MKKPDWKKARALFPALKKYTFVNAAGGAPLARPVAEAGAARGGGVKLALRTDHPVFAAFAVDGRCLAMARREYPTRHPEPGHAELDSQEVWQKTRDTIAEVAAATRRDPISALCVSSMGEACVPERVTPLRSVASRVTRS